jgi:PAS domain S-box-containing protein
MTAEATEAVHPLPVPNGPAMWPMVLVIVVGVVLSIGSFTLLRATEFARARADFDAMARDSSALIQDELTETEDSIESVAAFLDSSVDVTRLEFRSFTSRLLKNRSEILTVEWLPRVTSQDRSQFEARAHSEGLPGYRIVDDEQGTPASPREEYFPLLFVEPTDANRNALGLDHRSLAPRWTAMLASRDLGAPSAAGGFPAHSTAAAQAYTIGIFAPIYLGGTPPDAINLRRERLQGFVAIVFDLGDIVRDVAQRFPNPGVRLQIFRRDEASSPLIHSSDQPTATQAAYALKSEAALHLAGLDFRLVSTATPEFAKRPHYAFAWSALIAGLMMTALAFAQARSLARRLTERLQVQRERELLFNLSPDLLSIARLDGYFHQLNPAWERTLGIPRAELLKHPFIDFVHPDDVEGTRAQLLNLAKGAPVIDFENRYRCHDGSWKWLAWRATPAPEQDQIYAIARDVTVQRETLQELQRARRFAEHIAEVIPSIVYIYDFVEQRTIFANREVDLARRRAEQESAGLGDVAHTIHPQDLPRFNAHLEHIKTLSDGEVAEVDCRLRNPDDAAQWFHFRTVVFERNVDGSVRQIIGAATDITDRKRAEDLLLANNARLDFVLAAANMGVWEFNVATGATVWTEPMARMLGMSVEQAPRNLDEFLEIVHPEDRNAVRRAIEEMRADGAGVFQVEFRQNRQDGLIRWLGGVARFGEGSKSSCLVGLGWDITARRQAEVERSHLEEQMRQSQKLEALGSLAGGIAHEFNNMLTVIQGNARLALQELPPQHSGRECIDEIARSAARASDLVRRILAFSRNEEPAWQPVDLVPIVNDAVRLLEETLPANITIRFDHDQDLGLVVADPVQVQQALMNLGINARDAMDQYGGNIQIGLQRVRTDDRLRRLMPELRGDLYVCLSVEDTGPGMPPDVMRRIFEPFFTTRPPGQATGMGLPMVHGIMRRHGGAVLVNSRAGFGTKFELFFPVSESALPASANVANAPVKSGSGERILYVDDEEALVFLAVRMLKRMGFDAEGLVDARQAVRDLQQNPARWSAVITDLGMPIMNGLELALELRRIRPDLPIIITSGYVRDEDVERARAIGVHDIFPKPNTVEEMATVIAERVAAAKARSMM